MHISKQAIHKQLIRQERRWEVAEYVRRIVEQVRADHPTMGVRDIYYKMQPEGIGRDRFEDVCRETCLMACRRVNPCRTTDSTGVVRFPNLLEDFVVTEINQVWQSDITYFEVDGKFYYLTFILDAFSRRILGYSVSKRLFTEETVLPAFMMAMRTRGISKRDGLIFHSDGGGQYYSNEFLKLTAKYGIRNSMCLYSWENGKAERVNGVIKNNYLTHRSIHGFEELVHFQKEHTQGKLVRVTRGKVFDVAVDVRPGSATYGQWAGAVLSSEEKNMFYIPEGFAHGFLVLSDMARFVYKCTDVYDPSSEGGIPWNDETIAIDWPKLDCEYKTSEKDEKHESFKDQDFSWASKWL